MKKRTPPRRWYDAVHEAGHAVVAEVLGPGVRRVWLGRSVASSTAGALAVTTAGGMEPRTPERFDVAAGVAATVSALAGTIAERHARGWRAADAAADRGAAADLAVADRIARGCQPADPQAFVNAAAELAIEIVDGEWPAVRRVAEALLEAGELDGDRVAALVKPHGGPAPSATRRAACRVGTAEPRARRVRRFRQGALRRAPTRQ